MACGVGEFFALKTSVEEQHPRRAGGDFAFAHRLDKYDREAEFGRDGKKRRAQIEVPVGNMDCDHTVLAREVRAVEIDRFTRNEMHGNRVVVEGVDGDHVVPARRPFALFFFQEDARVADADFRLRASREVREFALREAQDAAVDFVIRESVAFPAICGRHPRAETNDGERQPLFRVVPARVGDQRPSPVSSIICGGVIEFFGKILEAVHRPPCMSER